MFALAFASLFVVSIAACDGDLFEVENPTNILDEDLNDPGLADALGNTPEVAVAGVYDNAVVWSAVVSDEGFLSGSGTFRIQVDEGFMDGYNLQYDGLYDDLASARWIADDATSRVEELVEDPSADVRVAKGYYWSGMARITLADLFEHVVYDNNPPITPREAIRDAIEKFSRASQIAQAANDMNLAAAAEGSLARAYRSLYFEEMHYGSGEDRTLFEEGSQHAREALALEPDFVEYANYAPPGSENFVYNSMVQSRYNRMDPIYAELTDPVSGEKDSRLQHTDRVNFSPRTGDPVYLQEKYTDEGADIPVSRADEARLIIAEYAAMTDDIATAVDQINAVRAGAGLPEFQSSDKAEVLEQVRYERRVELWLELRRWQDHRYYEIIPGRWAEANKQQGVHRRWPVSQRELDNNPAFRGQ